MFFLLYFIATAVLMIYFIDSATVISFYSITILSICKSIRDKDWKYIIFSTLLLIVVSIFILR